MCKRNVSGFASFFLMLFLLTWLLAACGDATSTAAPAYTTAAATTAAATTAAATTAASASGGSSAAVNKVVAATPGAVVPVTAEPLDRKIIRNATLTIYANDVEQTMTQLRGLAVTEGGIVFSENTSQQKDERPGAVMVLQIPTQNYERVITAIHQAAAKVVREESTAQDVTEEFVDVQSQITNLQRTEEGLQKLMDKATKIEDVLNLQRELTNVRGEIEKRQGRLNFLDKRSAFSTITINISLPPLVLTPTPIPAPPVAEQRTLDKAVNQSWSASLNILGEAVTVIAQIVVFLWWLFPILLVVFIWWRIRRMSIRKAETSAKQWHNG